MYPAEVQKLRLVRLQELGLGLDAQAVDQFLRMGATQAGVVGVSVDLIAGRLNTSRPRVRRALDALCDGTRSAEDERSLLLFDSTACVAYFPGQVDDLTPSTIENANKRLTWIAQTFPRCLPVEQAVAELMTWRQAFEARQLGRRPQQGHLSLISERRRVQE